MIKNSLRLTNKYIILLTPLLLYSLLSSIYLNVTIAGGKTFGLLFALLLLFLMSGAFFAGWFYMIKKIVSEDNSDARNTIIKDFTSGVGEYFIPSLGTILNIFIFAVLMLIASYQIGMNTIGEIGVSGDTIAKALESSNELKIFLSSLTM